jgi:molybdopterin converting factor small subunit
MAIVIELPRGLRQFSAGNAVVTLDGPTRFADAIAGLTALYPHLKSRLVTPVGALYDYVGIFVNDRRIAAGEAADLWLADGDVISLVPAMAGG